MPNRIYDRISSLICFSDYDVGEQDEMLEYLHALKDDSILLQALINSGVDNWEWYDQAIDLYNEYKEEDNGEGD